MSFVPRNHTTWSHRAGEAAAEAQESDESSDVDTDTMLLEAEARLLAGQGSESKTHSLNGLESEPEEAAEHERITSLAALSSVPTLGNETQDDGLGVGGTGSSVTSISSLIHSTDVSLPPTASLHEGVKRPLTASETDVAQEQIKKPRV